MILVIAVLPSLQPDILVPFVVLSPSNDSIRVSVLCTVYVLFIFRNYYHSRAMKSMIA